MKSFLLGFSLLGIALSASASPPPAPRAVIIQEINPLGNHNFNQQAKQEINKLLGQMVASGQIKAFFQTIDEGPHDSRNRICIELMSHEQYEKASDAFLTLINPWSYDNQGNMEVVSGDSCYRD